MTQAGRVSVSVERAVLRPRPGENAVDLYLHARAPEEARETRKAFGVSVA